MTIRCILPDDAKGSLMLRIKPWLCAGAQPFSVTVTPEGFTAALDDAESLSAFSHTVIGLLCRDMRYFTLAKLTDALPLPLPLRRNVLYQAVRLTARYPGQQEAQHTLSCYLAECELLHLEGFLRFRLPELYAFWQAAVAQAAEAVQLRRAYLELMSMLRAFVRMTPPRTGQVTLLFHSNGGCTITDAGAGRLDYPPCKRESLLSLLIGLAPSGISVYALSGQEDEALLEALGRVFAGKIRFFRC